MTTGWGAPVHAHELAKNIATDDHKARATDDHKAQEVLWNGLSSADRADVVIALGAQARLAGLLARTADGMALSAPQSIWERVTCDYVREFAIEAWSGLGAVRVPRHLCGECLWAAAEALADYHLTALTAIGIPHTSLAQTCAMVAARAH